jgi:TATA-box binding protein (TBP) (component of TFIID and TFIIIB)
LIIGKIIYDIEETKLTDKSELSDIIEIEYDCNPFINQDYSLEIDDDDNFKEQIDLNVNCMNVYFNIDYQINRQRLYEKLIDLNYICKYKPESYSGIKLIYKLSMDLDDFLQQRGICMCSNKCTCVNITFLIFQSGNVIATGFKTMDQIEYITKNFINLCNTLKENVMKRILL